VQSEIGTGTRFELSFPEAALLKRTESVVVEKQAVPEQAVTAQAVSTQAVSTQIAQTAVASHHDRLIR
jgi:hypothetical protein